MGHIRHTFHVDAPPERVWELAADAKRIPEWNVSFIEVKDVSGPLDRVGASYTSVLKLAGRRLEGRWELSRVEAPSLAELTGSAPGGGRGTYTARYEAAEGGTDVTWELEYELPGSFVGGIADKLFVERANERDFRHSAENFKAIVEAEVTAHA